MHKGVESGGKSDRSIESAENAPMPNLTLDKDTRQLQVELDLAYSTVCMRLAWWDLMNWFIAL